MNNIEKNGIYMNQSKRNTLIRMANKLGYSIEFTRNGLARLIEENKCYRYNVLYSKLYRMSHKNNK